MIIDFCTSKTFFLFYSNNTHLLKYMLISSVNRSVLFAFTKCNCHCERRQIVVFVILCILSFT